MKVQINSLEAMERLIGGDSEMEIEIRNNIVQEFTKKHLKALVNEGAVSDHVCKMKEILISRINMLFESTFGSFQRQNYREVFVIRPDIVTAIRAEAEKKCLEILSTHVNDMVKKTSDNYTEDKIARIIDERVNNELNERVNAGVTKRLAEIKDSI